MEHIDPENLLRDTRVILSVLRCLLTASILPHDYSIYARSLGEELAGLDRQLAGRLDLTGLKGSAVELERLAKALIERSAGVVGEAAERINASLVRASRLLVPLNYTSGERFHHDPALPQAPWPSLDGLWELARLPADSTETAFYAVHARQTRNRVAHALREANAVFRAALDERNR
jgi:hypothetical protein